MPQHSLEGIQIVTDHPALQLDTGELERLLFETAAGEGVRIRSVTVILSDHETVRDLNARFLAHDEVTDVIAFRYSDPEEALEGEVYVDLDTAMERHAEFDSSFEREAFRYAVHGLLHLCGHEDKTEEGRSTMRAREDEYLATLRM